MMFWTIQTIHFLKALEPRISKLILPSVSCTNTRIQIHKYRNTAYNKVPKRPKMWYIFEKRIVQGYHKLYSHMPKAQIQKYKYKIYKYTNTAYDEVPERPNMWDIYEKRIVQGCQKLYSHTTQT